MAWIRLSDDYMDHPKFSHLSDGAFRLWHHGMGYVRKYQTDGLIPTRDLRQLKPYSPKRSSELQTPWMVGAAPLWELVEGFGVKVHDYLEWNPSKDEENERRGEAKERMRQIREERRIQKGTAPVRANASPPVRTNSARTSCERSQNVLGREGEGSVLSEGKGSGENPDAESRAGALLERYCGDWFPKFRNGARLPLVFNSVQLMDAQRLVDTWDDHRLEKLATLVLTTDDEWIAQTDRGFRIFALKAGWADDRLKQWETTHGVAV